MARKKREGADSIYEVAGLWRRRCLGGLGSLFEPEASIWRFEYFSELDEKSIGRPDQDGRSFTDTVNDQLEGVSQGARQLMAELLYVHFLVTVSIGGPRKREIIDHVLSALASPPELPRELAEACNHGLVNPGTFFTAREDRALAFLIRFGSAWCGLDDDERARLLGNSWAFADLVASIEVDSAYAQRNALLHLTFPESFEAVVSDAHKTKIIDRFSEFVASPSLGVDQQLLEIRSALDPGATGELDFYGTDVRQLWFDQRAERPGGPPRL